MKFNPEEFDLCKNLFKKGNSTLSIQEYLMNKYNIKKSSTSNFLKLVRKHMGIYNKIHK